MANPAEGIERIGPDGAAARIVRRLPAPPRYGALLQFAVFNIAIAALVAAAWIEGLVEPIYAQDPTRLTLVITGVFALGLALCAAKVGRVSREHARLAAGTHPAGAWADQYIGETAGRAAASRSIAAAALRVRVGAVIAPIRHFANSLVLLGLIGTVIGFIIALSGIDPDAVDDVTAISPMVGDLLSGMAIALNTTLLGGALNLWLMVDYHILTGAAGRLMLALIAVGEADAGT